MAKKTHCLILIPARFASSRFPGKPLALINNKTMIQRVYENCNQKNSNNNNWQFDVCVVTDNQKIEDHIHEFGGQVCRVDDDVASGSERVYLAYKRFYSDKNYQLIINVQGDEPLLEIDQLSQLAHFHLGSSYDIATLVAKKQEKKNSAEFCNPDKVKAIFSSTSGECHYFSRSAIPFSREKDELQEWYLHIGVYSYKPSALEKFNQLECSHYEKIEKLEQLRAIENGMTIGAIQIDRNIHSVDTPEDIKELEGALLDKK